MNDERINKGINKRFINLNYKSRGELYLDIENELTNRNLIFKNSSNIEKKKKINTDIINKNILKPIKTSQTILKNDNFYIKKIDNDSKKKFNYNFYKNQTIPKNNVFPERGINMPNMKNGFLHDVLSTNTVDIENDITNRNVILKNDIKVIRKENIYPNIKKINSKKFFNTNNNIYIPLPLIVENNQRPKGPFC